MTDFLVLLTRSRTDGQLLDENAIPVVPHSPRARATQRQEGSWNPQEARVIDALSNLDVVFGSLRRRFEEMIEACPPAADDGVSDEMLMRSVAHHDPEALAKLYDRYGAILKALIVRVVHDEPEAEDLLQEIFVQLWDQADKFSPKKGKPLGWMVTMCRRRAIDRLRQRLAYGRAKERMQAQTESQPAAWVHNRIENDIELHDLHEFLAQRMRSLPPYQSEVIDLAFFKGMSQREIATETHTPLGTVKTRLELGLKKLSEAVRGLGEKI